MNGEMMKIHATIHVSRKQLGLDDDTPRDLHELKPVRGFF